MKIGISMGSNDFDLLPLAVKLHVQKKIDFVELYLLEDAKLEELVIWKKTKIPLSLHAPHDEKANFVPELLELAIEASKILDVEHIVFNAGTYSGKLLYKYQNAYPENMPHITRFGDFGALSKPTDVREGKFCLDVAHAWISAVMLQRDPKEFLKEYFAKNPPHVHIATSSNTDADDYCPLKDGVVDLAFVLDLIPENACVTIENDVDIKDRKSAIVGDLEYLLELYAHDKKG
ncbi:MAG: hypothetical protein KCHDKBKB_00755 [Elusimicrobia bacterium]|nr:hypothetical protein [Elusimicrobiota bacterium]